MILTCQRVAGSLLLVANGWLLVHSRFSVFGYGQQDLTTKAKKDFTKALKGISQATPEE
jgi:hypothetical protein